MKRIFILFTMILIVFSMGISLKAQSFTFSTPSESKSGIVKCEFIFDFPIINTTNQTFKVFIVRRAENIPSGWQGSMCFDNCYPPFMDSVMSEDIAPNDTVDFSYHFSTDSIPASGTVTLVAKNARATSDSILVTLTATTTLVAVNDKAETVYSYSLEQNYPNPFNPSTVINFSVPQRDYVTLKVYDLLGREISNLVSETLERGSHSVSFKSSGLSSGTYFYKLTAGNYTSIKKMIVLK